MVLAAYEMRPYKRECEEYGKDEQKPERYIRQRPLRGSFGVIAFGGENGNHLDALGRFQRLYKSVGVTSPL